ncbi:Na+/H+ antiporter NhaC family protein [Anaeromicrobium sediminis]|uniref:Na+/H+ antiporter NhaC-like C-terminal domain-containing protein n=1 Tax=Anaeromicrobium sediminis TaxID=1478221 RepID=A0A267MFJ4_9FIRM|nr:Na+/H+ antiporter NhaC family protein [Anaeromicrobium sediminis]PAB58354.1 hypothetical protein CCE28_15565 [Anaeromicrobium sediminis]
MENSSKKRDITFIEAFGMILVYVAVFVWGKGKFPTGMAILICAFFSAAYGVWVLKTSWDDIFKNILKMFDMGMPAILVLLMVGFISASWLASGTIPVLIVYGLKILNPSIFLVAAFLVTAIVAIATGSSWTIVATFGVALMGIAKGMGIPPGVAGGAIVSGCWLGDKWSPLSDTTNLGAAVTGEDVFSVFKYNFHTSGLGGVGAAIVFTIVGFKYSGGVIDSGKIQSLLDGINGLYNINALLLLPIVVVIYFAIKRKPVLPVLMLGVVVGIALAVIVQGKDLAQIINALYNGYVTETGVTEIDKLLSGGGLLSMMSVMLIIFCAFVLAGTLETIGTMDALVTKMGSLTKTRGPLVLTSYITSILATYLGGTAYTGVILNAGMYRSAYKKIGLANINLSRTVLEGSGHTSALVPWCGSHVIIYATLGITWADFLPHYYSFWVSSALLIIYGFTGLFTKKLEEEEMTLEEVEVAQTII